MGWKGFAKLFGKTAKVKMEDGMKSVTSTLARLDPEAVSQAQIQMLDDKLNTLREKLVKARRAYDKDVEETKAWERKADQVRQALRILKGRLEGVDESARAGIMDKARKLAAQLQNAQAEVEREKGEDGEKKAILDQIQSVYDQVKARRETMQQQLDKARTRMETAKMRQEAAKMREQEQKELAGLAGGFDEMGIALDAMNQATEEAETQAAMATMSADEMAAKGKSGDEDLLQEILGAEAKKEQDISDPFAGL
ncbi:MAG: hypothetical protein HQL52_11490 [Magnetococcales bacterium]|nr:hypothetical protein [Magnetococcales bacterium]